MSKIQELRISQVLLVQHAKREAIDITNYTRSIRSADISKRKHLYDVYDNSSKDPVLCESIRKQVRHITNGGLKLTVNSEEVEEMTNLILPPSFRKLLQ